MSIIASAMRRLVVGLGLGSMIVVSFGCGRQTAQPYVASGTLRASARLPLNADIIYGRGGTMDLIMTARSGPGVGDIIVQRRWKNVRLPMSFGLGKGIGKAIARLHPKIVLTALVSINMPPNAGGNRAVVGWTPIEVPVGTHGIDLELTEYVQEANRSKLDNYPIGGWYSPTVAEEAAPPGTRGQSPGPFVYGGTIDVTPEYRRRLVSASVFVTAKGSSLGAPELAVDYRYPTFPFRFALHENNRFFGDPVPITEPFFIRAIIDLDGSVDTKDDQVVFATPEKIAPGTDDLAMTLDVADLVDRFMGAHGSTGETPKKPEGPVRALLAGRIEVAPGFEEVAAKGKHLFLSAGGGRFVHHMPLEGKSLPVEFDFTSHTPNVQWLATLAEGDSVDLRAKLTPKREASMTGAEVLLGELKEAAVGSSGLVLVLKGEK